MIFKKYITSLLDGLNKMGVFPLTVVPYVLYTLSLIFTPPPC